MVLMLIIPWVKPPGERGIKQESTTTTRKRNASCLKHTELKCIYRYNNADSFINKFSEFKEIIKLCDFNIMGMTEVKPKNQRFRITPTELSLEDYDMFHNINEDGFRGTALMYINHFTLHRFISKINISGNDTLLVECIYYIEAQVALMKTTKN